MNRFNESIQFRGNPKVLKQIASGDPYLICDLLEKTKGGIYLRRLEDAIIKTGDIVQIYEFLFLAVDMKIPGFDQKRFEYLIRKSQNPKLMCYCMGFVPRTNIGIMASRLIVTHNTKYLSMILEDEEYSEVLEKIKTIYPNYEEIVEESKQFNFFPNSLAEFGEVAGDIEELKKRVIASKNPHFITELANYIEYLNEYKGGSYDISDLTEAQVALNDSMQAYEYLASVRLDSKEKLINVVKESNRPKFMYYVLKYVPDLTEEDKSGLETEILTSASNGKYALALIKEKLGGNREGGEKI